MLWSSPRVRAGRAARLLLVGAVLSGCPLQTWGGRIADGPSLPEADVEVGTDRQALPDADVPDIAMDARDVADVPDIAMDARDVADIPDVRDVPADEAAAACAADAPIRCGAACCAGPCAPTGGCDPIVGAVSGKSENVRATTCAWSRSGAVWCWGANPAVVPEANGCSAPVTPQRIEHPALVGVTQVAVADDQRCAITTDNAVVCWTDYTPPASAGIRARQLVGGGHFICALLMDGSVQCRGANDRGQLGRGYAGAATAPPINDVFAPVLTATSALGGVAEITAGARHACARTSAGAVYCWGFNLYNQLGFPSTPAPACEGTPCERRAREVTGLASVTRIEAGTDHTCATTADRALWCWGVNAGGQLCLSTSGMCGGGTPCAPSPTLVAGVTDVQAIAAGGEHTCVLRGTGAAAQVACCGQWLHRMATSLGPDVVSGFGAAPPQSLHAGAHVTCAVAGGGLRCWGDRSTGQLADGRAATPGAVQVSGLSGAVEVTAGTAHTCALTMTGNVRCWGRNRSRQLGDRLLPGRTRADSGRPVAVVLDDGLATTVTDVAQLAAGGEHTCARRSDGSLLCWGGNAQFQVGRAFHSDGLGVAQVAGQERGVSFVSAGEAFTCSIRSGVAGCWGANWACQTSRGLMGTTCAQGAHADVQQVTLALGTLAGVTAGSDHTCAWGGGDGGVGGAIVCWGGNQHLQTRPPTASAPDPPTYAVPVAVEGVSQVRDASAGVSSTCAVTGAGAVMCWGLHECGALGRIPMRDDRVPRAVPGITDAVAVRVGDRFACARTAAGRVRCWGRNDYFQLGRGTAPFAYVPVEVSLAGGGDLTDVVSLGVGAEHACAARRDGSVWCWGNDLSGQLGVGSPSLRTEASLVASWP